LLDQLPAERAVRIFTDLANAQLHLAAAFVHRVGHLLLAWVVHFTVLIELEFT